MYWRRSSAFSGVSCSRISAKIRRRPMGPLAALISSPRAMRSASERGGALSVDSSWLLVVLFREVAPELLGEFPELMVTLVVFFLESGAEVDCSATNFDPRTKALTATRAQPR